MQRTRVEIEGELDDLRPYDFSNWNTTAKGMERLCVLLPELIRVSAPGEAIQTILGLIERLSNTPALDQCELGTPGPMVHELEKVALSEPRLIELVYEPQLIESVTRFPTPLTVWMVNRLMNTLDKSGQRWASLLETLKRSAAAANAAPGAREDAKRFVLYQETP